MSTHDSGTHGIVHRLDGVATKEFKGNLAFGREWSPLVVSDDSLLSPPVLDVSALLPSHALQSLKAYCSLNEMYAKALLDQIKGDFRRGTIFASLPCGRRVRMLSRRKLGLSFDCVRECGMLAHLLCHSHATLYIVDASLLVDARRGVCLSMSAAICNLGTAPLMTHSGIAALETQLVAAVRFLHGCGVAHRDIKPANILRYGGTSVKLCDFGACTFIPVDDRLLNDVMTTFQYAAPEVLGALPYSATACDMWSVGVVLAEAHCKISGALGTNELLFDGSSIHEIMRSQERLWSIRCVDIQKSIPSALKRSLLVTNGAARTWPCGVRCTRNLLASREMGLVDHIPPADAVSPRGDRVACFDQELPCSDHTRTTHIWLQDWIRRQSSVLIVDVQVVVEFVDRMWYDALHGPGKDELGFTIDVIMLACCFLAFAVIVCGDGSLIWTEEDFVSIYGHRFRRSAYYDHQVFAMKIMFRTRMPIADNYAMCGGSSDTSAVSSD